ncbi:hypothetical protein H4R35_000898 [Dimargaris xerosporica]|nr:hypothetical protein H4R35_000898 [Dimargaris xerosporica]
MSTHTPVSPIVRVVHRESDQIRQEFTYPLETDPASPLSKLAQHLGQVQHDLNQYLTQQLQANPTTDSETTSPSPLTALPGQEAKRVKAEHS